MAMGFRDRKGSVPLSAASSLPVDATKGRATSTRRTRMSLRGLQSFSAMAAMILVAAPALAGFTTYESRPYGPENGWHVRLTAVLAGADAVDVTPKDLTGLTRILYAIRVTYTDGSHSNLRWHCGTSRFTAIQHPITGVYHRISSVEIWLGPGHHYLLQCDQATKGDISGWFSYFYD